LFVPSNGRTMKSALFFFLRPSITSAAGQGASRLLAPGWRRTG
jgi:hypothetical protein